METNGVASEKTEVQESPKKTVEPSAEKTAAQDSPKKVAEPSDGKTSDETISDVKEISKTTDLEQKIIRQVEVNKS